MDRFLQAAELALLVTLTILQLGRWARKTEEAPEDALRVAKDALRKTEALEQEFRRHKHAWQDFLNNRYTELDRTYARAREVELQLETIVAKQDADCDRITVIEEKARRIQGV
jgi:hypothetical protein